MEALKRKRATLRQKLTMFKRFLEPLQESFSRKEPIPGNKLKELEERHSNMTSLLEDFEEVQTLIDTASSVVEPDFESRAEFEVAYYEMRGQALQLIEVSKLNDGSNSGSINDRVKSNSGSSGARLSRPNSPTQDFVRLPTINLPSFDGSSENWLGFRDLFTSMIHSNDRITAIQKYFYLRSSVHGLAAQAIQSIDFCGESYQVAWDTLNQRFNNKRMLVHNHIKQMLSFEQMSRESSQKLRKLHDNLYKHLNALRSIAPEDKLFESIFIYLSAQALDPRTMRDWETHRADSGDELPTLSDFRAFIQSKADLLETLESKQTLQVAREKPKQTRVHVANNTNSSISLSCILCKKAHSIQSCEEFLKLDPKKRSSKVRDLKACINCLRKGHFLAQCNSKYTCKYCKAKHHSLIHFTEPETSNSQLQSQSSVVTATLAVNSVQVLLPTACVGIRDQFGRIHRCRALLDSGAQSNFVTANLCHKLGLQTEPVNINVVGIGSTISSIREKSQMELQSLNSQFKLSISCLVIEHITNDSPGFNFHRGNLDIPNRIKLADPDFSKSGQIDLLIGVPIFWELLRIGQIRLGTNLPILQKTSFGWVVSGNIQSSNRVTVRCNFVQEIQNQLERFWEIEQFPPVKSLTSEENACEAHFVENTKRSSDGRFVVSIPLKKAPELLGNSRLYAEKQLLNLEKRFQGNENLASYYKKFMAEYESLGHMSLVDQNTNGISCYLPHHGVLKEESFTTKLRVVFNGSSLTTSGQSLNALQMVGPTIQQDLVSILLRFRKHTYAISADIEKMYRQVLIDPKQRSLQRILWRSNPDEAIRTYELNTVTYGTTSAPFLAIRSLFQLGVECSHPQISRVIKQDFYVDDLLTTVDSLEDAYHIVETLPKILSSGGFTLRKWVSNDARILNGISPMDIHPSVLNLGSHEYTKTLGLAWSHQSDSLLFSISEFSSGTITKRSLLSEIAQVFDPLGLLSACTIVAKIILQQLWLEKLAWDQEVSHQLQLKWKSFRSNLVNLNDIRIPRHVLISNHVEVQMHGFCDASLTSYGACIYLRSENEKGDISINLLFAKAKVAPLKPTTIPRLELCGAQVLARAMDQASNALNLDSCQRFCWTDSTIVLGWLKTNPTFLKPFVCNRVVEIQELTKGDIWNHVPTKSNPADLLSRGLAADQLINSSLWWHGPDWLLHPSSTWPVLVSEPDELPEIKQTSHCLIVMTGFIAFHNYSRFSFLVRVMAYCLRFVHNFRTSVNDRILGPLSGSEINRSTIQLVKLAQGESFKEELKLLQRNQMIKTCGQILRLNPFLDEDGVIRVGGRLRNSPFSFDKKYPMLLSGSHRLSYLILSSEHLRLLHAGPQLLLPL